jgi:hypothetical protein
MKKQGAEGLAGLVAGDALMHALSSSVSPEDVLFSSLV